MNFCSYTKIFFAEKRWALYYSICHVACGCIRNKLLQWSTKLFSAKCTRTANCEIFTPRKYPAIRYSSSTPPTHRWGYSGIHRDFWDIGGKKDESDDKHIPCYILVCCYACRVSIRHSDCLQLQPVCDPGVSLSPLAHDRCGGCGLCQCDSVRREPILQCACSELSWDRSLWDENVAQVSANFEEELVE